jgi:hypothetical protein
MNNRMPVAAHGKALRCGRDGSGTPAGSAARDTGIVKASERSLMSPSASGCLPPTTMMELVEAGDSHHHEHQ